MPLYSATCPLPKNQMVRRHKAFSPANIAGLSLWLKADTGVTLSGSNVTAWADQSGEGNDAGIGSPPELITNGINNLPAIQFYSGAWLQIPENNIGNSGNITVFVVIDYTSGGIILNKGDAATFEATEWEIAPQNGAGYVKNDNENYGWNIVGFSLSGLSLVTMITTNGVTELFNNNTSQGTSSDATPVNQIIQYIGIGGGGTDGSTQEALDAKISEIIIYNLALSSLDRQAVKTYLNNKYAIF